MMKTKIIIWLIMPLTFFSCKKSFLEAKPNSTIVVPLKMNELQSLLDNVQLMNATGGLPQISADEYFVVDKSNFDALDMRTYRNAYLWQADLFSGETEIKDWNQNFKSIFCSNSVLDEIERNPEANSSAWKNLKGQALFFRAYAYYDLARNFCQSYSDSDALKALGLPLRRSASIDETLSRSNLYDTYSQILTDLSLSLSLLNTDFQASNKNRASKSAVHALLARIYLSMGKYDEAEKSADASLLLYDKIINYNSISTTSSTPFSYATDETIFYSTQQLAYTFTSGYTTNYLAYGVVPELISLYRANDLRLSIFFTKNSINNYSVKRGYVGGGPYAFTGLATDELLLIKSECSARKGDISTSLGALNKLLINRYKTGTFTPISINDQQILLTEVLKERRKELIWRALRWSDIKRLNKEGANIVLQRILNEETYTLEPNSLRYVFPIPNDEINLSGIEQNPRL